MYDAENIIPGLDIPENPPEIKDQLACFCCGICCHYRVFMSLEEAQRISADQKIPLEEFLELSRENSRFGQEHFWFGAESYLLKQKDGFCVFLKSKNGTNARFCSIHHVKPNVCREWAPTFHRPDCQQGIARYWHLTIDEANGTMQGPDEQLLKFNDFMEKLQNGTL